MARVRNEFLFKHKEDGIDVRVSFDDGSCLVGKVVDFDNETLMLRTEFWFEGEDVRGIRDIVLNLSFIYLLQTAPKDEPAVEAIGVLREEGKVE